MYHFKSLSDINGDLRPGIVHRLDKDTSGLLVIAKNDKSHVSLSEQIANKDCRRIYWALVDGVVKEDGDIICYHFFDRNDLEDYLFFNTRFETPSTSRHLFGNIYQENDEYLLKLNLQVRFK